MSRFVVATSGHVDHGKSTLVRALTGIEPDRLAEERRRGLTIDLGFAWCELESGREVAFVDVPGHERFLGNMLAGLGPAPVVLFVVAADQGWQQQSSDHLAAAQALGIEHGIVALSRCDLADAATIAATRAEIGRCLAPTHLAAAPILEVSPVTGAGMDALRTALDELLASVPAPHADAPVRLWIDRAFSIRGAGTVVTGTLAHGEIAVDDAFELASTGGTVEVRGLQRSGIDVDAVYGVSRVAVNLRGVPRDQIARGDALLSPDAWWRTDTVDVRRVSGTATDALPQRLIVHVGTAAVPASVRPFGDDHARLQLAGAVPLRIGDRMVLRDPGAHAVLGGVRVLDVDPPSLRRRGAGKRRAVELAAMSATGSLVHEVSRRGAMRAATLAQFGVPMPAELPAEVLRIRDWLVAKEALATWARELRRTVAADVRADPLSPGLTRDAALDALQIPDAALLPAAVRLARLSVAGGRIRAEGAASLGPYEASVAKLETRMRATPFRAPEADDLAALRLGPKALAAAERAGRLLRIAEGVVLLPDAPTRAADVLRGLPQPFTASAARQALDTTRRVAIPLLELLDRQGLTVRLADGRRELRVP